MIHCRSVLIDGKSNQVLLNWLILDQPDHLYVRRSVLLVSFIKCHLKYVISIFGILLPPLSTSIVLAHFLPVLFILPCTFCHSKLVRIQLDCLHWSIQCGKICLMFCDWVWKIGLWNGVTICKSAFRKQWR